MMKLILLLCLLNYSGTTTVSVIGKKGGSVTLPCEYEDSEISQVILISRSKNINVCQKKNCIGRVFKKGACDVIIKDLSFSDAGKYFLRVFYNNDQVVLEQQIREYRLHIHDVISVKIGEELKLDVLLPDAYEVLHRNRSTEWKEVWKRTNRVQTDRLTNSDGNQIINRMIANDIGSYIVLDSEGEILITVRITESGTNSGLTGKLNSIDDHETDDNEKRSHWGLFGAVELYGLALAVLIMILFSVKIKKMQ